MLCLSPAYWSCPYSPLMVFKNAGEPTTIPSPYRRPWSYRTAGRYWGGDRVQSPRPLSITCTTAVLLCDSRLTVIFPFCSMACSESSSRFNST